MAKFIFFHYASTVSSMPVFLPVLLSPRLGVCRSHLLLCLCLTLSVYIYLRQGGYVFVGLCLFVSLSVCEQDNSKSYGRIFLKF